jgi:hypothetical protein
MVATQVESPTNFPASKQAMDVLMDVKALAASSTTAAPAVVVKETQIAATENETATPAIEALEPERPAVHSTTNENAAANHNVEDNSMTDIFDDSKLLRPFVCFLFCVFVLFCLYIFIFFCFVLCLCLFCVCVF